MELTNLIRHSSTLRLALRASINITEDVSRRHTELLLHSGELSAAAMARASGVLELA